MQDFGIPEAGQFMTDFWKVIKKHFDVKSVNWDEVVPDLNKLGKDHDNPFSHKLILAFANYLEEEAKKA